MKNIPLISLLFITVLLPAGCATNNYVKDKPTQSVYKHDKISDINVRLAVAYLKDGQIDVALNKVRHALEIDPNNPNANNVLGLIYDRLGEKAKAHIHYQRAVTTDPANSEAHNNYGAFLCRKGDYAEANKHFLRAIDNPLYKSPESAYSNAGECAIRAKNIEQAEAYFRKALQINPKIPSSLYRMAIISYERGNTLSARAYLQRFREVAKHSAETLLLGINIEKALGDRNAMASYTLLLKARFPDSEQTRMLSDME